MMKENENKNIFVFKSVFKILIYIYEWLNLNI